MSRYFQLLISEEFAERRIPEDDSVRLLDQIVDELDLQSLACSYSRMGRKCATSPRTLLKIMIYANMEGIYSSRSIESSCKRDINFIWLVLCQDNGGCRIRQPRTLNHSPKMAISEIWQ